MLAFDVASPAAASTASDLAVAAAPLASYELLKFPVTATVVNFPSTSTTCTWIPFPASTSADLTSASNLAISSPTYVLASANALAADPVAS